MSNKNILFEQNPRKGSMLGADYRSTHEEMRPQIEHSQAIEQAERAVIDAAVAYRQGQIAAYNQAFQTPQPFDAIEQAEDSPDLHSLFIAQRVSVDNLIAARAALTEKGEE